MRLYKMPLSIGLILSSLITIVLATFSLNAFNRFSDYREKLNPRMELTLNIFHFFVKQEFKREQLRIVSPRPVGDSASPLKTFNLSVKQEDIDGLNEDLPTSGKDHYVTAYMRASDEEGIHKVKLRYRGDTSFHWLYEQKSLRIKLEGNDLYNMEKQFNLVNHPNWYFHRDIISYQLAKKLGLITPDYYPARVFINGKYMGVYLYLSQVDESLLRKHKVMPGSIYYGDAAKVNENGVSNLWEDESYWKKKSARNAEQKKNRKDIVFFVKSAYEPDENKFYKDFTTMFDADKFYSFVALDRLVGSGHHDYHHNHKIYFDPYKGKFEPIEWDVRVWSSSSRKDISLYPLLLKLKRNPILDAEIDKRLYSLVNEGIGDEISQSIEKIYNEVRGDLESDPFKDTGVRNNSISNKWMSKPFFMKDYVKWMQKDKELIDDRINQLKELYDSVGLHYNLEDYGTNEYKLNLKVSGESPVKINFGGLGSVSRVRGSVIEGKLDSSVVYPGRKFKKNVRKRVIRLWGRDDVVNVDQYYEFMVKTTDIERFISTMQTENYITGATVPLVNNPFDIKYDDTIIHPWDFLPPAATTTVLKGTVSVNKTLVFEGHENVSIMPGTTFVMNEGASVYFYGKVTAIGNKEQPIRFIAQDPKRPWGIVAVQGKAATGSTFDYIEVENGSTDSRNLINYTAPFNIHDVDWFVVSNCKIGKNFVGDDAMHVAYAKGVIDRCEFVDSRSDSLDVDISDVSVTNNIFYNSGNDGLDIMTTTMKASNNVFIDSGDKGISVGEWSTANILDSFFLRASIGLEVKDKSKVTANNLVFINSASKAINLYNKNSRYDKGGIFEGEVVYLSGNSLLKADKLSSITIKNIIEDKVPPLTDFKFYDVLKNSSYEEYIKTADINYAN